jgi:hypothetical protein
MRRHGRSRSAIPFAAALVTAWTAFAATPVSASEEVARPESQSAIGAVSDLGSEIVMRALALLGVPYRWGGSTPESGLDCSGFVRLVYQDALALSLPRRSDDMSRYGSAVAPHDLRPGDLVFFNTMRFAFSHVGIYIGDNQFVHAPSRGKSIRVENLGQNYWASRFDGARRLLTADLASAATLAQYAAHAVRPPPRTEWVGTIGPAPALETSAAATAQMVPNAGVPLAQAAAIPVAGTASMPFAPQPSAGPPGPSVHDAASAPPRAASAQATRRTASGDRSTAAVRGRQPARSVPAARTEPLQRERPVVATVRRTSTTPPGAVPVQRAAGTSEVQLRSSAIYAN